MSFHINLSFPFLASPMATLVSVDDPFTILPQDNPSFQLVSHPLDDNNYRCWSNAMTMALLEKNKFGFVDVSIPKPEADIPNYVVWERINNIVTS